MDVFTLHRYLVEDYTSYTKSFINIRDQRIRDKVESNMAQGLLWPEPLLQLNPSFESGATISDLVEEGVLHKECDQIFRIKDNDSNSSKALRLHFHQEKAIRVAAAGHPYVLTTGTGSGKSLAYIIPAVDHVLRNGTGKGIQAIVVYPMNALANSQREELDKFLKRGYEGSDPPVSYARYTGQEKEADRHHILRNPPDILLTNYVMLELLLTRIEERQLVHNASSLRFLVFDELHTYRGRQGADVSMLIRRCREAFGSEHMRCVGTSATMASVGTSEDKTRVVAKVATKIFGEDVADDHVIGETLRRSTVELDFTEPEDLNNLRAAVTSDSKPSKEYERFHADPLASWIESAFGLQREDATDKLVRRTPRQLEGLSGAVKELEELIGVDKKQVKDAIEQYLYAGSTVENPDTGFPVFAFRLHQFISRGDTVWASLENESSRFITLRGQQYVPGDRNKILLPLVFCRSCGQPYYRVDRPVIHPNDDDDDRLAAVVPRTNYNRTISDDFESGYLYISTEYPWPEEKNEVLQRVPYDWKETQSDKERLKRNAKLPEVMFLKPDGTPDNSGTQVAFVPMPFQFCLNPDCGVAYNARQRSDIPKLGTIGIDGRGTATTVLALATILKLRSEQSLEKEARKLLSFTDNRQDASLQAGHFNDFIEVGLIRSALYRGMTRVGEEGLTYENLLEHVERAMDLPIDLYSNNTELRGPALEETRKALREVLKYILYRDLQRGWRVTSPNLEQCGLLHFDYKGCDELAADQAYWEEKKAHKALLEASNEQRAEIIRVLLDHLRRGLIVKEDSLSSNYQDKIREQSRQRLCDPWVIEEDTRDMVQAGVARISGGSKRTRREDISVSSRSNFGSFLRRLDILSNQGSPLSQADTELVIKDLFRCLIPWGLVVESGDDSYQLPSSAMIWKAGDGSRPMVDPLRTTQESGVQQTGNTYFVQFYKTFSELGAGLEAREHTAQVQTELRVQREDRFRSADLPILFCSPTMELGVDIAQLNVVNMRNVPPTPANYAQRSGRAGRSGQPALVYTYCSGFSPHDQYYFKKPEQMVSGAVTAPRLDLLNRDLLQAHVHAVWLAEAGLSLGKTLTDVLVVVEDELSLPLQQVVLEKLSDKSIRQRAFQAAKRMLDRVGPELQKAPWYNDDWLNDILDQIPQRFEQACSRWKSLYKAAVQQRHHQNRVIGDHSRTQFDRNNARRLRAEAESQINLLTNPKNVFEGDFYSYRYFASEGFLPGYNFPRLPLSAFIPAQRRGRNEFVSRPRFLAISEFGPHALIYHEGARYKIHKVNLELNEDINDIAHSTMKLCNSCGYGHLVTDGPGPDICDNCKQGLLPTDEMRDMIRLQNVTAKRASSIKSDEEERTRIGFEIQTTFRFADVNGRPDVQNSAVVSQDQQVASLQYGDAAQIWRINRGWRQRKNRSELGFRLDIERGFWETNKDLDDQDSEDPLSDRVKRVIPYVEDHRNILTLEFDAKLNISVMASLQAAFKHAIQKIYQLESNELAAESLPDNFDNRRILFFYEASEGGAGVLRQITNKPKALAEIAREALTICHFDPTTGEDLTQDPANSIECEAACYDCLLDYGNQMDHELIDRHKIVQILLNLKDATISSSQSEDNGSLEIDELSERCESELERRWLKKLIDNNLRLPTRAKYDIEGYESKADFFYQDDRTFIYVDDERHDLPEIAEADDQVDERLKEAGYLVIRFHHATNWDTIIEKYKDIFGNREN